MASGETPRTPKRARVARWGVRRGESPRQWRAAVAQGEVPVCTQQEEGRRVVEMVAALCSVFNPRRGIHRPQLPVESAAARAQAREGRAGKVDGELQAGRATAGRNPEETRATGFEQRAGAWRRSFWPWESQGGRALGLGRMRRPRRPIYTLAAKTEHGHEERDSRRASRRSLRRGPSTPRDFHGDEDDDRVEPANWAPLCSQRVSARGGESRQRETDPRAHAAGSVRARGGWARRGFPRPKWCFSFFSFAFVFSLFRFRFQI